MTDRAKELIAKARGLAAAFRSKWGTKDDPGTTSHTLDNLATLAEQAIARAEKAEADLAEARRMLKEADNQIAWDHAARGVTVKFPGTHIALEATARHQAREGERGS